VAPGVEHLRHVVDDGCLLQQLEPLGVGLHDRVLDAVVDHLGEVAGSHRTGVHEPALLGLERVERRLHLGDVVRRAAAHQRVAVLQSPDASGDAAVDEPDARRGKLLGVDQVVGPA
jgi:hypothetical protein